MLWLNPFVNWPISQLENRVGGLKKQSLNESEIDMSWFFRLAWSVMNVRSILRDSEFCLISEITILFIFELHYYIRNQE